MNVPDSPSPESAGVWPRPAGAVVDVVIVEDDPSAAAIVKAALERVGYGVLVATDLAAARAALARHRPAFIVADVSLPDGNGLDLVRELRAAAGVQARIIILSGGARETASLAAFKAGADDFLAKPFDPNELVARLARPARS